VRTFGILMVVIVSHSEGLQHIYITNFSKVVRTGPDRPVGPVEPGTGPPSGPSQPQNRSAHEPENRSKTEKKPEKTGRNRKKPV
jgi:hypothetical protein